MDSFVPEIVETLQKGSKTFREIRYSCIDAYARGSKSTMASKVLSEDLKTLMERSVVSIDYVWGEPEYKLNSSLGKIPSKIKNATRYAIDMVRLGVFGTKSESSFEGYDFALDGRRISPFLVGDTMDRNPSWELGKWDYNRAYGENVVNGGEITLEFGIHDEYDEFGIPTTKLEFSGEFLRKMGSLRRIPIEMQKYYVENALCDIVSSNETRTQDIEEHLRRIKEVSHNDKPTAMSIVSDLKNVSHKLPKTLKELNEMDIPTPRYEVNRNMYPILLDLNKIPKTNRGGVTIEENLLPKRERTLMYLEHRIHQDMNLHALK